MASLESLNDDCLREILQYCDEDDLIAFVVAFEKFKPIVQDILRKFWRDLRLWSDDNCDIKICYLQNDDWRTINSQSLKIFVDLIQPFVEEIDITGANEEIWDIINKSQFDKATELFLDNTSAAPIVKACFPNLRSLVLWGHSVVEYNTEWNGLEHVDICRPDKGLHGKMEFISQLKLKKFKLGDFQQPIPDRYRNFEYLSELEELSGGIRAMNKLSNAFNVMQKLRNVSVDLDYVDDICEWETDISILSKTLGTRTVEFFIKFVYPFPDDIKYLENRLQEFPNLKRLTVEFNEKEPIQMFLRSCHLHLLKAVILSDMRVYAEILTNILISAKQLELLKIRCCWMFCTKPIHLDVARIEQKRSKPITINLDDGQELEILLSAPTDLIKITKNPFASPDYFVYYILEQQ